MANQLNKAWLGILVLAVLVMSGLGLFAFQAQQLSAKLANEQTTRAALLKAHEELQGKLQAAEQRAQETEALRQQLTTLTADRNNILAQLANIREDEQRARQDHRVLREVLKRSATKIQHLQGELDPLKTEHKDLQANYATLLGERSQLSQQLHETAARSSPKALQEKLDKERDGRKKQRIIHKQDLAELKKTKEQAKQLETRQKQMLAKLNQLKAKHDALNEQHAKILAENTAMKRQVHKVPTNVAKMAQQHERLLRETADMHYNMGVLFSKGKQYYQAVAEFRKVIELRPDDADAHYNLGVIYAEHIPDREKAVGHFRRYLEISPRAHDASWVKQYIASWQAWEAKERLE